jgi:hypothetical protein
LNLARKQRILALSCLLALMNFTGCSVIKNTGLGVFGDILSDAAPEIEKERSWEFFKEGVGAQVMLISTMGALKKDDKRFLFATIQGHAGYAFSVWDTLYLEDYINLVDESKFKDRAVYHYSRAVQAGEWYLESNGLTLGDLIKSKDAKKLLEEKLDDDESDKKIVLFLGQSLGGLINMQKDQSNLLTALPVVKAMFDWVCEKDPNIYNGTCPIFYGAYEAGRPKMLGGNPEKGKEIFLKAIKNFPNNLLIRIAYLQYYVIPKGDEDAFGEQMAILEEKKRMIHARKYWRPFQEKQNSVEFNPRLNLFNATALKRYEILNKNRSEIF